jgi:toluene-4-monooxygenase system protein B
MLVPVHGFVRGDTVGLLVLVHDTDTIARLGRVLIDAAMVRVAPTASCRIYRGDVELPPQQTLAALGVRPLERIDLVLEVSDGSA